MIKPRAIRKLPECDRCLLYAHNPFLVCAVHPEGVNSDSCLDFRLDPNAEAQLWEPSGARYIGDELVQEANATPKHESITGVVERLTFYSEESGYTVARLQRSGARNLTTITGNFATIQPGQTLQLTGFWRDHPQYGAQFQVTSYKETEPATLTRIEKYLGSGLIKPTFRTSFCSINTDIKSFHRMSVDHKLFPKGRSPTN